MTDKLEENEEAMELMEYIRIVEMILLPDYEAYEYPFDVTFVSVSEDEMVNSYSLSLGETACMSIFRKRYNDNKIVRKSAYKEYISDKTIQDFINDLKLDATKFWLLILFIYDYCENLFYNGITMKLTPVEQMRELYNAISQSDDDVPMTLTFKAGKRKVTLDSPIAIKFIADMIANYEKEVDNDDFRSLHKRGRAEENVMLKDSPYIAFFANILLSFFDTQPQIRAKRRKCSNHTIKETDFVCQIIHFTKISLNERWKDTENEMLKAFLKQYKNYQYPHNINSVYPDFSLRVDATSTIKSCYSML